MVPNSTKRPKKDLLPAAKIEIFRSLSARQVKFLRRPVERYAAY